jgi:hypothetical protein
MSTEEKKQEPLRSTQPLMQGENEYVSQSRSKDEQDAFHNRQLANETIEQEAEVSSHTNAADVDVTDTTEPAPAGLPKSIAND